MFSTKFPLNHGIFTNPSCRLGLRQRPGNASAAEDAVKIDVTHLQAKGCKSSWNFIDTPKAISKILRVAHI
ncbi:hypothetical protein CKO51_22645 [Rhodopirellula sp. SM50]|nr:hypothetical protein CKO51_22645 [Rhodopirellula sp. SM50]